MVEDRLTNKDKKEWINFVNVISCIAVVFLHTNGCFWTFSRERYWFTANVIESVFYFAVPCFFMITGATLMDYRDRYPLRVYFEKRIKKTLIPFVAWSVIGTLYAIAMGNLHISDVTPGYIWDAVINAKAVSIYWFFPVLFGLYMTIPLLAAVEKSARKEIFSLIAVTYFVFGSLIPFLIKVFGRSVTWNSMLNVQLGGYVLYLVVGYLLAEYELTKEQRTVIYILGITGLLAHISGTYYLSISAGEIVQTYKGYLNVPCIMCSISVFAWCRYNAEKLLQIRVIKTIVSLINPYTLGIYLLQYFIYATMIKVFDINTMSIVYRIGAPLLIIPVAAFIVWMLRRIPVLKYIVP